MSEIVGEKALTELAVPAGFDFFRLVGPESPLAPGRGYYCVLPESSHGETLRTAVLRALGSSLRDVDSYLIIIREQSTLRTDADEEEFEIAYRRPDPVRVLRSHLLTRTSEQRVAHLIDDPEVCDEARQHSTPRKIRVLAEELSGLTDADLADTYRWRGRAAEKLVQSCLTPTNPTSAVRRCALLFACVTINRGLLSDVLQAAALLVGFLSGTRSEHRPTKEELFAHDIDVLLSDVGASCYEDEHGQRLVNIPPIVASRALPLGLRRKPDLGRPLIEWLRHLVERGVVAVSRPAAATLGVLAAQDFSHVCRTVIEPWVRSTDLTKNEAAGAALEFAVISAEELGGPVQYALHTWAYSNDWNARRSALFAWSTSLGRQAPDPTLETLLWLARRPQYRRSPLLSYALTSALSAFDLPETLRRLVRWNAAEAHGSHAGRCFVRLVREHTTELGELLRNRRAERDLVRRLWGAALNDTVSSDTAFRLFFDWAEETYNPTDSDDPAVELATRLVEHHEVRKRLAFHAQIHQHFGGVVPSPIADLLKGV